MTRYLRVGLIIVGLLLLGGGVYFGLDFIAPPAETPEVALPPLVTPTPIATASATSVPSPLPTETNTPSPPTSTPRPEVPAGGIVYSLSPDINSVGWVQAEETGNHFGESYLYTGLREGITYHGAMQFDLSFIPKGSTIFLADLQLTGLVDEGLTEDSTFTVNILEPAIDSEWPRHGFQAIRDAVIDETLTPALEAVDLARGGVNKIVFNAAQRSIIEDRLDGSPLMSFRVDSIFPEGWFAWDSGYGPESMGQGPILRLGVLPPVATDVAQTSVGSTPTPTPTVVVITSTPTPENVLTLAAIAPTVTYEATTIGTATPVPSNWVTPIVVTSTPIPENTATALFQWAEATAVAVAYGTPTATPQNVVVATPTASVTPTPIFILLDGELPPMTPVSVPTLTAEFIPSQLIGKIVFKSDRSGQEEIYVINPDGSGLALLSNCWAYALAEQADVYSANGRFRVFTKDTIRYKNVQSDGGETIAQREDVPALYWYDSVYKTEEQLTEFGAGIAYGGVWSSVNDQIAFVSTDSGNDEIWVVNRDGSNLRQLTRDEYSWWDKHPSWSPNGKQLVFWSNRTGHGQIWVMDADGSNLYSLSRTGFNDWDPVWIKYLGIPVYNSKRDQIDYIGSLGTCSGGPELNCSAFDNQAEAQAVYESTGGPIIDIYGLDIDRDGMACNATP